MVSSKDSRRGLEILSWSLSKAVYHGQLDVVGYLLEKQGQDRLALTRTSSSHTISRSDGVLVIMFAISIRASPIAVLGRASVFYSCFAMTLTRSALGLSIWLSRAQCGPSLKVARSGCRWFHTLSTISD